MTDHPRWLKADDVAELVGMSRSHIYRAAERGELAHIRIGGSIRFPALAIDRLLREVEGEEHGD